MGDAEQHLHVIPQMWQLRLQWEKESICHQINPVGRRVGPFQFDEKRPECSYLQTPAVLESKRFDMQRRTSFLPFDRQNRTQNLKKQTKDLNRALEYFISKGLDALWGCGEILIWYWYFIFCFLPYYYYCCKFLHWETNKGLSYLDLINNVRLILLWIISLRIITPSLVFKQFICPLESQLFVII